MPDGPVSLEEAHATFGVSSLWTMDWNVWAVGYISKHMCSFGSFVLNEVSAYLPPEREVQENEVAYVWNEDLWKLQPGLERDLYHIQPVIYQTYGDFF